MLAEQTKDFPDVIDLIKIFEFYDKDTLIGHILVAEYFPVLEIHINIIKRSKYVFSQIYIWFHKALVPFCKDNKYTSITCNDSGTNNPKFKKLIEDFGFKTKTIVQGTIKL